MTSSDRSKRVLWLAIALLTGALAGLTGGGLAHLNGDHPARSVMVGGATFVAGTTLMILLISFLLRSER